MEKLARRRGGLARARLHGGAGDTARLPDWMLFISVGFNGEAPQGGSEAWDQADDPIYRYEKYVNRLPLLTRAEEIEMGRQVPRGGRFISDLVSSNLRFVVPIARGYAGFHQPLADLVQEGNLGLFKAAARYPKAGQVRFMQFADRFVHGEIREFILRNRRLVGVRLSREQQDLYFRIHKVALEDGLPFDEARVAARLKVRPAQIRQLRSLLHGQDVPLEAALRRAGRGQMPIQAFVDASTLPALWEQSADYERQLRRIQAAVDGLAPRIGDIVRRRWLAAGKRPSLRELAREQGVSGERMRQLEGRAFQQIRKRLARDWD